jgi:[acyl-carrier-protein] S-malonyltransferase
MAAILGLEETEVQKACGDAGGVVQAVNFNAPGQVVIAGEKAAVARAIEACKTRGAKRAMPLPVSAPFHSSLMKPAGDRLAGVLQKTLLVKPEIDLINNVDVGIEARPDDIRHALVRQAYSPVRWVEIVRKMVEMGATHIIECGPGKVLSGLVKRISPETLTAALADRASLEQALKC